MSRIVVITGGTSGIGESCAKYFKDKGDTVVILARKQVTGAENFFMCDVSIDTMVADVFEQIHKQFGKIDVLINNAGHGVSGATELISREDAEEIFNVNYFGVLNCMNKALPFMNKGGRIINMSSVLALFPVPFRSLYVTSKAAVNMLTFSVDMEVKPSGIRVLAVCPADVKTNFSKNRVKVFGTNERYGQRVKNATDFINENEAKRMDPSIVAKATYNYSIKKNPKPFIMVGAKYKFLYFVTRFFPTRLTYKIIGKMFDGRKPKK